MPTEVAATSEVRGAIAGLAVAIGAALSASVVRFVIAQPTSILRNLLFLHPAKALPWLAIGIPLGTAYWLMARVRGPAWLIAALIYLSLALILWNRVQYPPLSSFLLPPVAGK